MDIRYLLKTIALALGIAILLPLLTDMSLNLFMERPGYKYDSTPEVQERYEREQIAYERYDFFIKIIVGILSLVTGFFLSNFLGSGFIFGGIICIVLGYFAYWNRLDKYIRFISILAIFALICLFGFLLTRKQKGH